MFTWNASQWTEQYVASLIGQPESSRLEFKAGRSLAKKEERDRFVRNQLSPALSAFANSEGGVLVIGLDEDSKARPRVANQVDGVLIGKAEAIDSLEQFQQVVDSSISPFLAGIRIKGVPLSGEAAGRWALIVYVPQGSTAYQAKDHVYYSRSEFETKPMPDHEVRLRMLRGRIAQARVAIRNFEVVTAEQDWRSRQASIKSNRESGVLRREEGRTLLEAPRRAFDEYRFEIVIENIGEVTIRDLMLYLRFDTDVEVCRTINRAGKQSISLKEGKALRFRFDEGVRKAELPGKRGNFVPPTRKLFPGDHVLFPDEHWYGHIPADSATRNHSLLMHWAVYLDDTPPAFGEIDILDHFQHGDGFPTAHARG